MGPEIGFILPVHGIDARETLEAAAAADAAGLDAVWVPDHLLNATRPRAGVLECEALLAAVAAVTRRARVGPLVLTTAFRHPPLLAKRLASVEAMASGRLRLGLGAGGFTYEDTCRQLGYPLLTPGERIAHVEETVGCLRALWSDDPAAWKGRFAEARDVRIHPRPTAPVPVILAARRSRMLALCARVADGWNCPLPHELEAGLSALAQLGRTPADLAVSVFSIAAIGPSEAEARRALERAGSAAQMFGDVEAHHVFGAPERAAARIAELHRQGAAEVCLDVRGLPPAEAVDLLVREVLPRIPRA